MVRFASPNDDLDSCGVSYSALQELHLGPSHDGSCFGSTQELREAWTRARGVVMRIWANNGRRPQAWWCFDAPGLGLEWPGYFRQQSYLYEHDALEEPEREQFALPLARGIRAGLFARGCGCSEGPP
jgi:hypothetical protein